ncbi:fibronectin type III domain-containing protein [Eubacterium pyruvativorans]|uniref:fibronectin type III domain-containing protein n=1 Tax=Eubacterium pyruvativorans TaxID=155865 RepID=UPI003F8C18E7
MLLKKKLAVLGLAAVMTVAFMPAMAFADAQAGSDVSSSPSVDTPAENNVVSVDVNGQKTAYPSLVAAFNAVKNKQTATLTLLKNTHGSGLFLGQGENKNITIDFNNHTYTMDGTAVGSTGTETQCFHLEKGNTVTLKNGTLMATAKKAAFIIQNYCNLSLDHFTIDGSNNSNVSYGLSNNNGEVNISNSTIKVPEAKDKFAFDVCGTTHYPDGAQVSVSNSNIIGNIQYDVWTGEPTPNKVSLSLTDDTVNGNWVIQQGYEKSAQEKFTVNSGSYSDDPSPYVNKSTAQAEVTNGTSTTYAVGTQAIQKAAEDFGNTVTVTNGSVNLTGAIAKIVNADTNKNGTVTVDGWDLNAGDTVQPNASKTIKKLEDQIADLQKQIQAAASQGSTASANITSLKSDLAKAQAELKEAQAQVSEGKALLTAPGQVMNLKAKAGKRSAKLTWKAQTENTTGYRIYRKVKGGKYARVKTITKATQGSWTNKGLKKGKTYYFKVRAYKSITSGELWGAYSNTAKAKVK